MNTLSLVIHDLMRRRGTTDLSFVQIGAHDGKHLDPIYPFVKKYHWRGLLVEPQPAIFERLKANYGNEPQLGFECAAIIVGNEPEIEMSVVANPEHEHGTMLASLLPEAITNNTHGYKSEAKKLKVKAMTLAALFRDHNVHGFDIFQVDCEGFDRQVIAMLMETPIRPAIINFEHAFFGPEQLGEFYRFLNSHNYDLIQAGIDTICVFKEQDEFARIPYEGLNLDGRKA